jgi:hypothetical protein
MALIEPETSGHECLTGVVVEDGGDLVAVDIGGSPPPGEAPCECTASFFSPEALYRATATLRPHAGAATIVDLDLHEVERIQRRAAPRARISLPVVLSNFDDPDPEAGGDAFTSVTGESIDIGTGGCRVCTARRFPSGCDPTVTIHVADDEEVIALAAVLEEHPRPDGCFEYRLVFIDPEDHHQELLAKLLATAA